MGVEACRRGELAGIAARVRVFIGVGYRWRSGNEQRRGNSAGGGMLAVVVVLAEGLAAVATSGGAVQ